MVLPAQCTSSVGLVLQQADSWQMRPLRAFKQAACCMHKFQAQINAVLSSLQGTSARRLVGIDVAVPAMTRGAKRLMAMLSPEEAKLTAKSAEAGAVNGHAVHGHVPDARPSFAASGMSAASMREKSLPQGMVECWSSPSQLPAGTRNPPSVHLLAGNICAPHLQHPGQLPALG